MNKLEKNLKKSYGVKKSDLDKIPPILKLPETWVKIGYDISQMLAILSLKLPWAKENSLDMKHKLMWDLMEIGFEGMLDVIEHNTTSCFDRKECIEKVKMIGQKLHEETCDTDPDFMDWMIRCEMLSFPDWVGLEIRGIFRDYLEPEFNLDEYPIGYDAKTDPYRSIIRVFSISPDGEIKLVLFKSGNMCKTNYEHVSLDGLEERKIGLYLTMKGRLNPVATQLINMLQDKYGYSTYGDNARGFAYLYDDDVDMTQEIWNEIKTFIKTKNSRGVEENNRLHAIDMNAQNENRKQFFQRCGFTKDNIIFK
jgi:hypothetical protein